MIVNHVLTREYVKRGKKVRDIKALSEYITNHLESEVSEFEGCYLTRDDYKMIVKSLEKLNKQEKILREIHEKFTNKLWHESEDVLGEQMIRYGEASDILWNLFLEYGLVGCGDEQQTES